jgi:hypothetical protein
MKYANKVKKPFDYTPASVSLADPDYLRKKFAAIRKQQKQQEEEKKAVLVQQPKLRKVV